MLLYCFYFIGQRGQSVAIAAGGQDKGGKDKERTRGGYAVANIRHPPPPPTTSNSGGGASAAASGSSSTSVEDDRARVGRSGRPQQGEEHVYDRSPKQQHRGRQGAEKVYELLSKAKASRQDRERENKGGQSPASIERQTSAPGGEGAAAVYAKPKRHAPPPPGSVGGAKKGGGASFEVQISEGPPDYSAVMGSRDGKQKDVCATDVKLTEM